MPDGHIHLPLRYSATRRCVSSSREADRSVVVIQLLALHHGLHVKPRRHVTLSTVLIARLVVGERIILHRRTCLGFLLVSDSELFSLDGEFLPSCVTTAVRVRIEFIICREICYAVLTFFGDYGLLASRVLVRWSLV